MPKVDINGVKIYYETSGDENATPMIWHGHNHKDWMFQMAYFSEYYFCISYDRRGCGFTEDLDEPFTMKDLVDDVAGLMDALGIGKAIVGGSSVGGSLSMNFAIDYLDRTLAAIVNGTAGVGLIPLPNLSSWHDDLKSGKIDLTYQPISGWWEEIGPATTNPDMVKWRHGSYYLKILKKAHERSDWMKLFHAKRYSVAERAHKLETVGNTIPILIMEGSHESQIEILAAYELHKRIPNSEFIINMDCYHATPREHPELFNERVHKWLNLNGL